MGNHHAKASPFLVRVAAGFSMIELLAVLAIVCVLAALIVPVSAPIVRGWQLTQGAQMIVEQLSLARQTAVAKNCKVEVRFYQFSDAITPGDPKSGAYRAVQLFQNEETGSKKPLGKLCRLPQPIIIDSNAALSSIIGLATAASTGPVLNTGEQLDFAIPPAGSNYNAVCFNFLPGGATDCPFFQDWFLTLHNLADGDGRSAPPPNFVTLQLDPSNGHIRTFRP